MALQYWDGTLTATGAQIVFTSPASATLGTTITNTQKWVELSPTTGYLEYNFNPKPLVEDFEGTIELHI